MVVRRGMAYLIKSNEKHSIKAIGKKRGLFLDAFSPPREDYLKNEMNFVLTINK